MATTPQKKLKVGRSSLLSAESVNEDQVPDAVADACLTVDPKSKVARETATKDNMAAEPGETTPHAKPDHDKIVRAGAAGIGNDSFVSGSSGVDGGGLSDRACEFIVRPSPQKKLKAGRHILFSPETANEDQASDAAVDARPTADPKSKPDDDKIVRTGVAGIGEDSFVNDFSSVDSKGLSDKTCEVIVCPSPQKPLKVGRSLFLSPETPQVKLDNDKIVRAGVAGIGDASFVNDSSSVDSKGLRDKTCEVIVRINKQSPDIAGGVHVGKGEMDVGARDQASMFGSAETENQMPLTHSMATRLGKKLTDVRKNGKLWWLRPHGKTQVTIEYSEKADGSVEPTKMHTIVISTQHAEPSKALRSKECIGYSGPEMCAPSMEEMNKLILEHVIKETLKEIKLENGESALSLFGEHTHLHINPSGKVIIGGPQGEAGLTGRKIISETYGGWGAEVPANVPAKAAASKPLPAVVDLTQDEVTQDDEHGDDEHGWKWRKNLVDDICAYAWKVDPRNSEKAGREQKLRDFLLKAQRPGLVTKTKTKRQALKRKAASRIDPGRALDQHGAGRAPRRDRTARNNNWRAEKKVRTQGGAMAQRPRRFRKAMAGAMAQRSTPLERAGQIVEVHRRFSANWDMQTFCSRMETQCGQSTVQDNGVVTWRNPTNDARIEMHEEDRKITVVGKPNQVRSLIVFVSQFTEACPGLAQTTPASRPGGYNNAPGAAFAPAAAANVPAAAESSEEKAADAGPAVGQLRVAHMEFESEGAGELALKIGETARVTFDEPGSENDSRWVYGRNETSGDCGWFPLDHTNAVEEPNERET